MPELPEVETVRRGLEPFMAGSRFKRVVQRRPDLRFPLPDRFSARLTGRRVMTLGRRAKYLLARLDDGATLLMHLGMTGRFTVHRPETPGKQSKASSSNDEAIRPGRLYQDPASGLAHDHVVFTMEDGTTITYNDPRRFGYMDLIPQADLEGHKLLANLGVEPLGNELSAAYLALRAHGRKSDLKAFLLDQRIVAGLGNIYVCEALFRAGLSPKHSAGSLATKAGKPADRTHRLVPAIRSVLQDAIGAGGSTLRDYRHADGELGYFQHSFDVYDREGEPCKRDGCRGTVRRIVQSGRSTFYCGVCQR